VFIFKQEEEEEEEEEKNKNKNKNKKGRKVRRTREKEKFTSRSNFSNSVACQFLIPLLSIFQLEVQTKIFSSTQEKIPNACNGIRITGFPAINISSTIPTYSEFKAR
jgi:hypothetical protein